MGVRAGTRDGLIPLMIYVRSLQLRPSLRFAFMIALCLWCQLVAAVTDDSSLLLLLLLLFLVAVLVLFQSRNPRCGHLRTIFEGWGLAHRARR